MTLQKAKLAVVRVTWQLLIFLGIVANRGKKVNE